MKLKTFGDSPDGYIIGIYGTVIVNIMQRAILKTNRTPEVLFQDPGNQNGSGYKCISLAFSTKENLGIYIILQYLKPWLQTNIQTLNQIQTALNQIQILFRYWFAWWYA